MKVCKNCNLNYRDNVNFCPECGSKLEIKPIEKICINCGNHLEDFMAFCPECGEKYSGQEFGNKNIPYEETKVLDDTRTELDNNSATDTIVEHPKEEKAQEENLTSDNIFTTRNVLIGLGVLILLNFVAPWWLAFGTDESVIVFLGYYFAKKSYAKKNYLKTGVIVICAIFALTGCYMLKEHSKKMIWQQIYYDLRR